MLKIYAVVLFLITSVAFSQVDLGIDAENPEEVSKFIQKTMSGDPETLGNLMKEGIKQKLSGNLDGVTHKIHTNIEYDASQLSDNGSRVVSQSRINKKSSNSEDFNGSLEGDEYLDESEESPVKTSFVTKLIKDYRIIAETDDSGTIYKLRFEKYFTSSGEIWPQLQQVPLKVRTPSKGLRNRNFWKIVERQLP